MALQPNKFASQFIFVFLSTDFPNRPINFEDDIFFITYLILFQNWITYSKPKNHFLWITFVHVGRLVLIISFKENLLENKSIF